MSRLSLNEADLAKVLLPGAKEYLEQQIQHQVTLMTKDIVATAAEELSKRVSIVIGVEGRDYISGNVIVNLLIKHE